MTDENVPVTRTPFTLQEYSTAMILAWRELCGDDPSKASVACVWAQYALETGRGAFCWNYNIGNVKYTAGHDYMMLRGVWEIIAGKRVVFEPPHRATWFNAYESLDQSMAEHLLLLKEKRFASSWPAIVSGDPVDFAVKLKSRGYYTAPLKDYAAGLTRFHADYLKVTAYDDAIASLAIEAEPTNSASTASYPTIYAMPCTLDAYQQLKAEDDDDDGDGDGVV